MDLSRMIRKMLFLVAFFPVFFLLLIVGGSLPSTAAPLKIPKPKSVRLSKENVAIGPKSMLKAPPTFLEKFAAVSTHFSDTLGKAIASGDTPHITVEVLTEKRRASLSQEALQILSRSESYQIDITSQGINILGSDELGALHGLTTLESLIIDGKGMVKKGQILDWPDHKIRAVHATLWKSDPEKIKRFVKMVRFGHFNTLVLQIGYGVKLSSIEKVIWENAWTTKELLNVVGYARQNGLDVVPETRLLTHLDEFLEHYPHLRYNKFTYDPRKEETYSVFLPIIDEVIELIKPKAFHIGHDEVAGHKKQSKEKMLSRGEEMLPKELFLMDVKRLHTHLAGRGVETWMWGDMLVSPEEFPRMLIRHLHGTDGYASLRGQIPKDIVILDWHYADKQRDFPSAQALLKAGYKVIGATWDREETTRNFSRYLFGLTRGASGGMIATLWRHFQDSDWDTTGKVLTFSSENFWNAK